MTKTTKAPTDAELLAAYDAHQAAAAAALAASLPARRTRVRRASR